MTHRSSSPLLSSPLQAIVAGIFFLFVVLDVRGVAAPTVHLEIAPAVQWAVADGGNGHYYQAVAVPQGVKWEEAKAWALTQSGYLATIGSATENDFVFGLVKLPRFWRNGPAGNYSLGPWLGGFHLAGSPPPADGWRWSDSQPFSYSNWLPGQPDGAPRDASGLHFFAAGRDS